MEALGHARFALVGHDRGARVGYRLALDHPGRLERLSLLDILPTFHVWAEIRAGRVPPAHWGFLSEPSPKPEQEIGRAPLPYFEGLMAKWSSRGDLSFIDPRALHSYRQSCNEPNRIHAFCEDYRAGATLDVAQDEADLQAEKRVGCPVQVIWSAFYLTGGAGGATPLDIWRRSFAPEAVGTRVVSGHFVAEENAPATLAALRGFLAAAA
jgi:haloacetate dehalogenase